MPDDPFEKMMAGASEMAEAVFAALWPAWYQPRRAATVPGARTIPDDPATPDAAKVDPASPDDVMSRDAEKVLDRRRDQRCRERSPGTPMYNLRKAKDEIDAVANHASDIAAHMIAMGQGLDSKLAAFRTELLGLIEGKFAELERTILGGDHPAAETSAVADLGAKVSLLTGGVPAAPHAAAPHAPEPHAPEPHVAHEPHGAGSGHAGDPAHPDHHETRHD